MPEKIREEDKSIDEEYIKTTVLTMMELLTQNILDEADPYGKIEAALDQFEKENKKDPAIIKRTLKLLLATWTHMAEKLKTEGSAMIEKIKEEEKEKQKFINAQKDYWKLLAMIKLKTEFLKEYLAKYQNS